MFGILGNLGTLTLSTPVELWVKMDGEPIRNLDPGWDNQIVLPQEALSGEGNQGEQLTGMAELFALFFEALPHSAGSEPGA